MYYEVLVGSQRYHGDKPLTYSCKEPLENGQLVSVPLGKKTANGVVIKKTQKPSFKTKPIVAHWPGILLPDSSTELLRWMQAYYPGPTGPIVDLFLPAAITKTMRLATASPPLTTVWEQPELTNQQKTVLAQIKQCSPNALLLHGETGSGKTRIYLELARENFESGKSVVILTPEIGLTKPLLDTFVGVFGDRVIGIHSAMSAAERRAQWLKIRAMKGPVVVIGPRSALFMPTRNIGAIVVDEAHDGAYKQDQSPRYHATRVAAQLRRIHNATLLLGTATPSVSDYWGFLSKELPIVRLKGSAIRSTTTTNTYTIDSRDRSNFTRSPYLSDTLIANIQTSLENNEQSLLFLNKRGSARLILCRSCGWRANCPRCDTALTFHGDTHDLRCHSCETTQTVPNTCPSCNNTDLIFKSIGTKSLESEVKKLFPAAKVGRFDGDTHKANGLSARISELRTGAIDIIIGTQSITKGFDLPKLSVVGIVQADTSLGLPDFTASERTFQLISQVSGRIGRGHRSGVVIVQTYNPNNRVITQATKNDYSAFYATEIKEREKYDFPPFVHLMVITCSRKSRASTIKACNLIKQHLQHSGLRVRIDGPAPKFIERKGEKYYWQLVLRSKSRSTLVECIALLPTGCTHDIDPDTLL